MPADRMVISRRRFTQGAGAAALAAFSGPVAARALAGVAAEAAAGAGGRVLFEFTRAAMPEGALLRREGRASLWDASGVLRIVGRDVPRFDHDPLTGELLGLVVEPSASNLLAEGGDFVGPTWTAAGMERQRGAATRPMEVGEGTLLRAGRDLATMVGWAAAEGEVAFSCWMRRAAGHGRVDLTLDGGATWTEVTAHLLGGDWVRLQETRSLAEPQPGFRLARAGDAIAAAAVQLEAGPFATSEIVAGDGTAAREADVLVLAPAPERFWRFRWPTAAVLGEERHVRSVAFAETGRGRYDITVATPRGSYVIRDEEVAERPLS